MGPEGIILVNPPNTTLQQSLTHSAMYPFDTQVRVMVSVLNPGTPGPLSSCVLMFCTSQCDTFFF